MPHNKNSKLLKLILSERVTLLKVYVILNVSYEAARIFESNLLLMDWVENIVIS